MRGAHNSGKNVKRKRHFFKKSTRLCCRLAGLGFNFSLVDFGSHFFGLPLRRSRFGLPSKPYGFPYRNLSKSTISDLPASSVVLVFQIRTLHGNTMVFLAETYQNQSFLISWPPGPVSQIRTPIRNPMVFLTETYQNQSLLTSWPPEPVSQIRTPIRNPMFSLPKPIKINHF